MSFKRNYIGLKTIAFDEVARFMRIWPQTLLSSSINMMLFFIIFSCFATTKLTNNIPYMQFIAPGLIMMAIIVNSYGNVAFSVWGQRAQGSIDEVLISPLPHYLIIIGYCLGGMLRGLFVGLLVLCISLHFTQLQFHHLLLTLVISICTAALFSLAGFINAICADKFDDVLFVPTFILTPLSLLGGIFYAIPQLSEFWQRVSMVNPIVYIIDTFRYGILGAATTNVYLATSVVFVCVVALFTFTLYLMKQGVGISK